MARRFLREGNKSTDPGVLLHLGQPDQAGHNHWATPGTWRLCQELFGVKSAESHSLKRE